MNLLHTVRHYASLGPHAFEVSTIKRIYDAVLEQAGLNTASCETRFCTLVDQKKIATDLAQPLHPGFTACALEVSHPEVNGISGWCLRVVRSSLCEPKKDGQAGPPDHLAIITIIHDLNAPPARINEVCKKIAHLLSDPNSSGAESDEPAYIPTFGVALSGGGLRATLFHLGVLRFLLDAKLLRHVTHIVAISGGSILASHVALHWKCYTGTTEEFERCAAEVISFCRYNIRGRVLVKTVFFILCRPIVWILLLWQKFAQWLNQNNGPIERNSGTWWGSPTFWLSHFYDRKLFRGFQRKPTLTDLSPDWSDDPFTAAPSISILATGIKSGTLCSFTADGLQIESPLDGECRQVIAPDYPLSQAVAASSAFPVLFPPLKVTPKILRAPQAAGSSLDEEFLSDGGVFDNSGIRKMAWFLKNRGPHYTFDASLLSDAGAPFKVEYGIQYHSLMRLLARAPEVLMRRVSDLEDEITGKGVIHGNIPLVRFDIEQKLRASSGLTVHPIIQGHLASIRTDLDEFHPIEIRALVKHGYSVARAQMLPYLRRTRNDRSELEVRRLTNPSWDPPIEPKIDLSTKEAAQVLGQLNTAGRRRLLRAKLFFQWEFSTMLLGGLAAVFLAVYWVLSAPDRAVTREKAYVAVNDTLDSTVRQSAQDLLTSVDRRNAAESPGELLQQFSQILFEKFQAEKSGVVASMDAPKSGNGTLTITYYSKDELAPVLTSLEQKLPDKAKRLAALASLQMTGELHVTSGRVKGAPTIVAFAGNVQNTSVNKVPGPHLHFTGSQDPDNKESVTLSFIQIPAHDLNQSNKGKKPFQAPRFFTTKFRYDSHSEVLSGEFTDPDVGKAIGLMELRWSPAEPLAQLTTVSAVP